MAVTVAAIGKEDSVESLSRRKQLGWVLSKGKETVGEDCPYSGSVCE